MISQPRFKWEQDCENVYKSLYEWCRKPWDVSFKLQAEIRIARASHRYPVGCVYSMTSPPFLSHPFPSPFISFNSPLPRSYLMFLLAVSLPPPIFLFSSVFLLSLTIPLVTRRGSCGPKCPSPMKTVWPVWPGTPTANALLQEDKGDSFINV